MNSQNATQSITSTTSRASDFELRAATISPAVPALDGYLFGCPSCKHVMNAGTAEWCLCLSKRPSVVCDRCNNCLCKAEPRVLREFWQHAPAALVAKNVAVRNSRAARSMVSSNSLDVIVVDDDEEIRMVAAYMLQEMGYRVMTAVDAADALRLMETVTPSLVITDALMPKVDGRQLCRFIKAEHPGVRVVIMTSLYTATRYKNEAMSVYHADDFVAKPVEFERLSEVVGRFVPRASAVA